MQGISPTLRVGKEEQFTYMGLLAQLHHLIQQLVQNYASCNTYYSDWSKPTTSEAKAFNIEISLKASLLMYKLLSM